MQSIVCRGPLDIEWDRLHEERSYLVILTTGVMWSVYTTERDRVEHRQRHERIKAIDARLAEMVA